MPQRIIKEKSLKFFEVRDPEKAVGLWSYHGEFVSTLHPIDPTRQTLGKFFNSDLARYETHAEALEMMAAKGWQKSPSRKLQEYAAQYLGERFDEQGNGEWLAAPRWFKVWHNFAKWLDSTKTMKPYEDVRLSFGYPVTGEDCGALKHRTGRVILLKKNGRNFVAVMMKEGWYGWNIIEKTAYQPDPYERLVLSSTHGAFWQTVDADIITELVQKKEMCFFEMERSPFFDALTDPKNQAERLAKLSRHFEFYVHDPNGPNERFYMTWSATFNVTKGKYTACDKSNVRLVEVLKERKRDWVNRQIKVNDVSEVENAARWVATNNGCIVLAPDVSDELRNEVNHALFYITFPDRPIDAPGGILRGYQLPGRMVQYATGRIRFDGAEKLVEKQRVRALDTATKKRKLIVDTLLDRSARIVAERNGLTKADALKKIEAVNGRAVIETAAWRWGFMEGNALQLFAPTPQAGSLKLPDLSLALGFEHRVGLDGAQATVGKLVQTAPIRSLKDSLDAIRYSKDAVIPARRLWTPKRGAGKDTIVYAGETVRIVRDEGRYFLLAFPKFALYQYERDLLFDPSAKSVSVKAYRCVSTEGVRSRHDNYIEEEVLDWNKIQNLAKDGRVYFYALDIGADRWLFDATYALANKRPCRMIPTVPQLFMPKSGKTTCHQARLNGVYLTTDVPSDSDTVEVRLTFTVNPHVVRDGRKLAGRSWKSYCEARPSEAKREIVNWPSCEATAESLNNAARRVVESDGVLLTDAEHLQMALDGMGYVVTQSVDPYAPGGIYYGYMISDRVFKATDGRVEWRVASGKVHKFAPEGKFDRQRYTDVKRKENNGKPLVEVLSATLAKSAEEEFAKRIEAEVLSDKKTSKFFTLEAPIAIGDEFKEMVAREFRRVAYTGTMGWRQQIVRPAHEVALGIWLARLQPDPSLAERAETRQNAPVAAPKPKAAPSPAPAQAKRLATLDALLAEGLVTQAEYDAKRIEILENR